MTLPSKSWQRITKSYPDQLEKRKNPFFFIHIEQILGNYQKEKSDRAQAGGHVAADRQAAAPIHGD